MNFGFIFILILIATVIGAFGSLFLKMGSANLSRNLLKDILNIFKNYKLLIGVGLFAFSSVFYIYALSLSDLSLVYPITSLTYVWVSFLSIKFLNERMNSYKWVGIVLIIAGVFFITK